MIPHSQLFETASHYSHTMSTVVDIYHGATNVYPNVPVVSGSVKCDRESKIRWSATVEIGLYPWELLPLVDIARSRFKVYRGITSIGFSEMLQLGEYRIDSIKRTAEGSVSLSGSGLESYLIDDRFLQPRLPPYGQSTVQAITDLVTESVPGTDTVIAMNTHDRGVTATSPWARARDEAVTALADSIGVDVYADHSGTFVITNNPNLDATSVPVFTVAAGDGGVLISESDGDTRDKVYNAVSVSGRSGDTATGQLPVWGWAYDANPASPTYYYGDFGQKPRFYTNTALDSAAQCVTVARNQLALAIAANKSLSFTAPAICFLEAGDVIQIVHPDGTRGNYLLQQVSLGLGHDGTLSSDTYVIRTDLAES